MEAFLFILTLISVSTAFICLVTVSSLKRQLLELETGLIECATRTSQNKLHVETLSNKMFPPKKRRGRPRKNTSTPKIIHQLNGE